jgi:hypothetical protein
VGLANWLSGTSSPACSTDSCVLGQVWYYNFTVGSASSFDQTVDFFGGTATGTTLYSGCAFRSLSSPCPYAVSAGTLGTPYGFPCEWVPRDGWRALARLPAGWTGCARRCLLHCYLGGAGGGAWAVALLQRIIMEPQAAAESAWVCLGAEGACNGLRRPMPQYLVIALLQGHFRQPARLRHHHCPVSARSLPKTMQGNAPNLPAAQS